MATDVNQISRTGKEFVEHMAAAAFVCSAENRWEIYYANQSLIRLFESDSYEDFLKHVGNCFEGMVSKTQYASIYKEIMLQVKEKKQTTGRLFYHIMTKTGNLLLAEEHWSLVQDEKLGPVFYCFLISREHENGNADYDPVTGLYGKSRFQNYVTDFSRSLSGKTEEKYAVAYLNLVNFKLLNVNKGIDEGDACLRSIADSLSYAFEDAFMARLSDDHFVIMDKLDGLEDRMEISRAHFRKRNGDRFGVIGKWGYYAFTPNDSFDAEKAVSYAKIACDQIKYLSDVFYIEYSEQLAKQRNLAEHLVRSFDEALEKGWIKVYYQPVIRSITGRLCGMESLVRWNDPKFGFIMPGAFISVLEESRQIHKLDSCVVEQVCKMMHERVVNKQPIVPVSVNFSRLDFVMCDMLKVVETAVEKYDIPRDYVHIEITESMIASDETLMRSVIDGFRAAGYEIWMDDFGSGYSSLTVLKDYQFDMLKLDMNFLSNFTNKSRDIMRSAILMAKDLGIKTLAEGVETKEHLDYLRDIGCEQIQGYYYGKPEPIEDLFEHLMEKGIPIETRKWRHFYEVASFCVKTTDAPLEVIEDDGKNFCTLFMNEPYREQIGMSNLTLAEIDNRIYHSASPLLTRYREFADKMKATGNPEIFYYSTGKGYLCLRGQAMVQQDGHSIIRAALYNMASDPNAQQTERLDNKLRALNLLFKVILHADMKNQTLMPLLGTSANMKVDSAEKGSLLRNNLFFADNNIFPTERIRYRAFMDFSTLRERIEHSPFGYVTDVFQIKQPDGNYRMAEVSLMIIPDTNAQEFLYCVKPYWSMKSQEGEGVGGLLSANAPDAIKSDDASYRLLWDNMLWNSSVKYFWKDQDRRFLGASQAYLDFFGYHSVEEIIGKTNEDLNLHVSEETYREQEIEVIQRGTRLINEPGQCIANGMIRNIVYSKMPIYKDGFIVGIAGFFLDAETELKGMQSSAHKFKQDPVTNLMDAHAFVDALIDYAFRYHEQAENYGIILLRNLRHERIVETYGTEFANAVLKEIGAAILEVIGRCGVVARTKDSVFGILLHANSVRKLEETAKQLRERLSKINTVDDKPITMRFRIAKRLRTQEGIMDENIYDVVLREITKEKNDAE